MLNGIPQLQDVEKLDHPDRTGKNYWGVKPGDRLSAKEQQVLELMFQGNTNKEIGSKLNISHLTVKNHVQKVIIKLNVKPGPDARVRAIYLALKYGVLKAPKCQAALQQPVVVVAPELERLEDLAKVEALDWLRYDELVVSPTWRVCRYREARIMMLDTEMDLLIAFILHPHRVLTRQYLIDLVWGHSRVIEERVVDVHVGRLRTALKPYGLDHLVSTDRGYGYRFGKALPQ